MRKLCHRDIKKLIRVIDSIAKEGLKKPLSLPWILTVMVMIFFISALEGPCVS